MRLDIDLSREMHNHGERTKEFVAEQLINYLSIVGNHNIQLAMTPLVVLAPALDQ